MSIAKQIHDLYNQDAFQWYNENAKLLREKKFELIDIENLVEEIESMGRNECNRLESFFVILFLHLLKLKYQPDFEVGPRDWKLSVKQYRNKIRWHLKDNPSLKGHLASLSTRAYEEARIKAARETGLKEDVFPEEIPFRFEDALQEDWFP